MLVLLQRMTRTTIPLTLSLEATGVPEERAGAAVPNSLWESRLWQEPRGWPESVWPGLDNFSNESVQYSETALIGRAFPRAGSSRPGDRPGGRGGSSG